MLKAVRLTKCYSSLPAIQDLSFSLEAGQVLGCLGPNGSGKSTTVKMLAGLLPPTRGEVLFQGENIHNDLTGYRRRLGYVPEEPHLYPYLSGQEYLELVGTLREIPKRQLSERIRTLLMLFALHPSRYAALGSYSKGMRQRILLIAALLGNPDILILDEPLSGLDVTSALILKSLVRTLGEHGRLVFYCSHVLEVVEKVCTHLLILRKGTVIAQGTSEKILETAGRSLEATFLHLVAEVDTAKVAQEIFEVMSAA